MAPYLKVIVPVLWRFGKTKSVVCSRCGFRGRFVRNGSYRRYFGDQRRRVQRYLCPVPACEAVTFSVLPIEALPIVRLGIGWMWVLLLMSEHWSRNQLASIFECGRATVRRRIAWAQRFFAWIVDSGVIPEVSNWGIFCDLVSRAFFPGRRPLSTHQHNLANS